MEYFHSEGGNNKPFFIYRCKVDRVSTEMYTWAQQYPSKGPFSRFHVIWNSEPSNEDKKEIPLIQFESRDAYLAFQYAFAGEIIEDLTWKEYR